MTILELIQTALSELGLPDTDSVIGATDSTVKQLLSLTHREGERLRSKHAWPELTREHSITLVDAQEAYEFPADYDRQVFETHWDSGQSWRMIGPISPQEWSARKHGVLSTGPERRYRVKGFADAQFYLDPIPVAGDAGDIVYFEYQSATWCRPKTWTTSTTFAAGAYCWYNGNIYKTSLGGLTGVNPPVHSSGSSSDGGVSWTFQGMAYEKFLADTDEAILNPQLIIMGIKWRWRQSKRLEFNDLKKEYEDAIMQGSSKFSGAPVLYLHGNRRRMKLISLDNAPDTGYGD